MWQCPTCKREFLKTKQTHSCREFSIENHFKGKGEIGRQIFHKLVNEIKKNIGPVKIESLSCCIHLVGSYTFCGVWIQKDGIKIDFRLDHKIESERILKELQISANRYMFYFEIKDEKEIDTMLLEWIRSAYFLN